VGPSNVDINRDCIQVCRCIPIDPAHRQRQFRGSEGAALHSPNTWVSPSTLHSQTLLKKRKNEEPHHAPPSNFERRAPPAQNDTQAISNLLLAGISIHRRSPPARNRAPFIVDALICAPMGVIPDPFQPGNTKGCQDFLTCKDNKISWNVLPFAIDIPWSCTRYCVCVDQATAERWRFRVGWDGGHPPPPREPHKSTATRSASVHPHGVFGPEPKALNPEHNSVICDLATAGNYPRVGDNTWCIDLMGCEQGRLKVLGTDFSYVKESIMRQCEQSCRCSSALGAKRWWRREGWFGLNAPAGQVHNNFYERSAAAKATTTIEKKNSLVCRAAFFHDYPNQGDTSICEDFMACEEGRLIMTRRDTSRSLPNSAQRQCEHDCRCASADGARRWRHRHGWVGLDPPPGSVDNSIYARSAIPKKRDEVPSVLRCNVFVIREFPTRYHSRRCSELMGCEGGRVFQRTEPRDENVMRQCSNQCRCLTQEAARARDAEAMNLEVEGGYVYVHGEGPRPRSGILPRSPVPKEMDVLPNILRCSFLEIAYFPTAYDTSTCSDIMGCTDGTLYQRRGPQNPNVMNVCSYVCRCLTQEEARRQDLNTVSLRGGGRPVYVHAQVVRPLVGGAGGNSPQQPTDTRSIAAQITSVRARLRPRSALAKSDDELHQPYHLRCADYSVANYPRSGETNTCQDIIGCLKDRVIHKYGSVRNAAWKSCLEHCVCVSQWQVAIHFHPEPERGGQGLALPTAALRPSSFAHSRRDEISRAAYPINSATPSTHGPPYRLGTTLAKRGLLPFSGPRKAHRPSSVPSTLPIGSHSPDPKNFVLSSSTFEPDRATTHDIRCAYYAIYMYRHVGRECQAFMGCFEGRVVQKNGPESAFVQLKCVSICNCVGAAPAARSEPGERGGRGQRGHGGSSGVGAGEGGRGGSQGGTGVVGEEHRWRGWWAGRIQLR